MIDKYVGLEQYKRSIDSIKEYVDKSIPYIREQVIFTLSADKVLEIYNSDSKMMEFDKPSNINLDCEFIINYNNEDITDVSIISDADIKGILCNNNNYFDIEFFPGYDINQNINENKMVVGIPRLNTDITPTDVVLKQIKTKYLNNKYLKNDVAIRNSITIGSREEGYDIGQYSFSNGKCNISSGYGSHAEGFNTTASEENSHSEGSRSIASGFASHAEGNRTEASGHNSHAEGINTTASGENSHAEGSSTTASGDNSHAEGYYTEANGSNSHAEGNNTTASGDYSHAEGRYTIASGSNSHVQGKFNIEDTENKYAHIVGNGNYNNERSNAHTLDWNGNAWYAGKLSQDGTPTEDKDLTTKKYVDGSIANLPIKKVISAQENPIIISNLSDGIYDFGNTSYSKMFDSDTEILENILGICILYTPDQSKRVLFVNYQSRTAYSYDYRYDLDMNAKVYYTCRYSKIINIGGATTRTVIILNEIPVEGVFGIYRTNCNSLKLTESSQAVILNNGPKILLMFRSGLNNIHTYTINVFCADFPKKIVYEYDTSTSEATLISDCDYALKDYVDDSITEQITSSQATDEEVDTMLQTVLGGDYSNEQ